MDGENRIRAYIGPTKAGLVTGLIALLLAAVGAVMMVVNLTAPKGEPEPFRVRGTVHSDWSYLDVVGISDWVYRSDDVHYHIAEDAEGRFYVVHISESRYRKMTEQQAYWNEETTKKVPVRLTGLAKSATDTMKSYICQAVEISPLQYGTYFGSNYLDATSTPNSDAVWGWGMLAVLGLILGLVLTLSARAAKKRTDRALAALGGYAVEQAAAEMDAPTTERVNNDRLRLGEQYLFGKHKGMLLRYDQVVWAYQQVQRTNFIVTGRNLLLGDEQGNLTAAASFGRKGEEQIAELMRRIAARNPSVLLGFSAENRRAWQERVKAKKNM